MPDGSYRFHKVERPTGPIDVAQEGEFALKLHEAHPEAPLSPVYINLRNLPKEVLDQVGVVMAEIDMDRTPDVCAGIPNAGVPLAEEYAVHSGIPVVDVFGKVQEQQGRRITAAAHSGNGQRLRIVDDLATQGETKLESVRAAEEMGYEVADILVLVDRQQGAVRQLKDAGYTLHSAFTIEQLLQFGVRTGRMSQEQYQQITHYLNP